MSVRSTQAITIEFTTSNPTTQAALNADSTPVGTLVVNGADNGASVTVTNVDTGRYKAAVTLPTLAIGDIVELSVAATVSTIAGKAIVWRDTKDVLLDGSGDVTFSNTSIGTVTTLTNLPPITTDWLTGTGVAASAVTKIQSGLATPTNITAGTITTTTNLTNAPTSGDFTATMKTSITTAATAATPVVGVGAIATDAISAAAVSAAAVTKIQAGLPTAASIATAVWTDTTAGDFTTSTSPGKIIFSQLGGAFTTTSSSVFSTASLANGPTGGGGTVDAHIVSSAINVPAVLADGVAHGGTPGSSTATFAVQQCRIDGGTSFNALTINGGTAISISATGGNAFSISSQGAAPSTGVVIITPGNGTSVHQRQQVQILSATGGSYALMFDDVPGGGNEQWTDYIAYGADNAAIQTALEALSNWPGGTVSGDISGRLIDFTTFVNYHIMAIEPSQLIGTPVTTVAINNTLGDLLSLITNAGHGISVTAAGSGKKAMLLAGDAATDSFAIAAGSGSPIDIFDAAGRVTGSATLLDATPVTDPGGVASTFPQMLVQVWRYCFKRKTKTVSGLTIKTYADDNTTVRTSQPYTDDGAGNQTQGTAT